MMDVAIPARVVVAISDYEGDARVLESAIGAYVLGAMIGYRGLHLIHSRKTLRSYQAVLRVRFREEFAREGCDADRLVRADVLRSANFWKTINGGFIDRRSLLTMASPF